MGRGTQLDRYANKSITNSVMAIQKTAESDSALKTVYGQMNSGLEFKDGETLEGKFATVGEELSRQYEVMQVMDPVMSDGSASERERKKVAKSYQKKKTAAKDVAGQMHKKITKMAADFAVSSGLKTTSWELPEEIRELADCDLESVEERYSEYEADVVAKLQTSIPKMYDEMKNVELMCNEMLVEGKNEDFLVIAKGELAMLKARYEQAVKTVKKYLPSQNSYDEQFKNHPLAQEKNIYPEPVIDPKYEAGLRESMKPFVIDFNVDYEAQLTEAQAAFEQAKAAGANPVEVAELEKKALQLEIVVKTVKEAKRVAEINNTTPEQVQEIIIEYLKKLSASAEMRMKMSIGACYNIMLDRFTCGKSSNYDELIHKHICSNPDVSAPGNIAFGYVGNGPAVVAKGYDKTAIYGQTTVTYNSSVRDRATFVLGNSLGHYDEMRAAALNDPDLLMTTHTMASVFKRAIATKNDRELDVNTEANQWNVGSYSYAECQYHGRLTACDIQKISLGIRMDLEGKSDAEIARGLRNISEYSMRTRTQTEFTKLYELVKVINANPAEFDREDMEPLEIEVYGSDGIILTLEDIDRIFRANPINDGSDGIIQF